MCPLKTCFRLYRLEMNQVVIAHGSWRPATGEVQGSNPGNGDNLINF